MPAVDPPSTHVYRWFERTICRGQCVSYGVVHRYLPEIHEHDLSIALDILVESDYLGEIDEDLYVLL